MRRWIPCAVLLMLACAGPSCHSRQVRLPAGKEPSRPEKRALLLPETFRAPYDELLFSVEAPVGFADAIEHPLEGLVIKAHAGWNETLRPLRGEFDALAAQHNSGAITADRFDRRLEVLLAACTDLKARRVQLELALAAYRTEMRRLNSARARTDDPNDPAALRALDGMQRARRQAEAVIAEAARRVAKLRTGEP